MKTGSVKNQVVKAPSSFPILLAVGFGLMLIGSYLSSFQIWLTFNQPVENAIVNQMVSQSGIRSISSNQTSNRPAVEAMTVFVPAVTQPVSATDTMPEIALKTDLGVGLKTGLEADLESVKIPSTEVTRPGHSDAASLSVASEGVEYANATYLDSSYPVFIEYPDELILEFPEAIASKENLKRAISKVLLSSLPVDPPNLLNVEPIRSEHRPFYYKKIRNQKGRAIRYPVEATVYADFLLKNHTSEVQDSGVKYTTVHIPLSENKLPLNVEKYKNWVEDYATLFKVPVDLVFAIMEVESAFNPHAVSKSNALGLMQLKANTAGRDVYQLVDGKKGEPARAELFDAQNNIRMGTAYMGLLKHEYLQGVRNLENKEMLSISSYNGGISKTLKLFGNTAESAIIRVNQLHPRQVYRTLRYEHQSDEARLYLDKVMKAKNRYRDLLDLNV